MKPGLRAAALGAVALLSGNCGSSSAPAPAGTNSRAVFIAETIPNHVAMMTGVNPSRSGIASNNFLDFTVDR